MVTMANFAPTNESQFEISVMEAMDALYEIQESLTYNQIEDE